MLELPPGKYPYSVKLAGRPARNNTVEVTGSKYASEVGDLSRVQAKLNALDGNFQWAVHDRTEETAFGEAYPRNCVPCMILSSDN
jgi:hypothetical protein